MPQLNVADFSPQLVWLVITFAALYLVMAKVALPRIAEVLEARQDRIADDLELADTFRQEAEQAMADYEASLTAARATAQEITQATRDQLAAKAAARKAEVDADLAAQVAEATQRIGSARSQAMANLGAAALEAARATTARLVGVEIGEREARAAIALDLDEGRGDG